MDFEYSDEQGMFRDSIAKWAAAEYEFDKRRAMLADPAAWRKNWAAFAELGLLAIPIAEEQGGLGGGALDVAVIMEEFGKALIVEPYVQTLVLGAGALKHAGAPDQQAAHLPAIAAGERVIAFAQAEPKSRWNLADVMTTARKQGAGYVLNGAKAVVIGGPQADHLLVSARTGGGPRDAAGVSLFLFPKALKGVAARDYPTMDGFAASEIHFENVALGAEHLVGPEGAGLPVIERIVDEANAALCAEAVGCLRVMHALTVDYAKTRKQFGRAIGEFQVLQHVMVDMFMALEESVSMALLATLKLDTSPEERGKAVSGAKVRIGKAARFIGQSAIQIHGGMGVTDEMRVAHYFKRATLIDAQFGNVDHHLKRYMALSAQAA